MASPDFQILTVCSGNICRSPMAERLLIAGLATVPGISVTSAGTIARPDMGMPVPAVLLTARYGGDPSNHRSRYLTDRLAGAADLVLGMSTEHRTRAVSLSPSLVRRAFTIREFARLSALVSDDDLRAIATEGSGSASLRDRLLATVRAIGARRGVGATGFAAGADDVIDPYQGSDALYQQSANQLVPAVHEVVRVLSAVAVADTAIRR